MSNDAVYDILFIHVKRPFTKIFVSNDIPFTLYRHLMFIQISKAHDRVYKETQ